MKALAIFIYSQWSANYDLATARHFRYRCYRFHVAAIKPAQVCIVVISEFLRQNKMSPLCREVVLNLVPPLTPQVSLVAQFLESPGAFLL